MAPRSRKKNQAGRAGITHFPLPEERDSRKNVPSRAQSRGRGKAKPGVGGRLSRTAALLPLPKRDGQFEAKGVKGGKTGGSRAGLLSASRKARKKRK
jgi:hypothetical protein